MSAVRRIPLSKNDPALREIQDRFARPDEGEKRFGVERLVSIFIERGKES
jgi:hypothetical protein